MLAIPPAERDSLLRLIIAKTSDLGSDGIYFYLNDELVALLVAMGPGESGRQQRAFPVLGHLTSRWNTTPPELLMRALENMRRDDVQVESREQGKNSPLYMVTDQGVSGVAHLVRLEELLGFDLPHGAIVGIPREHAIVAVPIRMSSDVASIEPMHQLVTSVGSEASDGLSTDVFWFHRGQLHPLNARSKDGKLEEIFPPDGFLEFIEKLPRG